MVRRRANRVLFERIHPVLARWPENRNAWLEALPASIETRNDRTLHPGPGVSWTRTRTQGWPPRAFVGRWRNRVPETLLSTVMRWTLERLETVIREGANPRDQSQVAAGARGTQAISLLGVEPLRTVSSARPTRTDLIAVGAEGFPWRLLVAVAEKLLRADDAAALAELALEVVEPFDDLSGRLFHLAVLGEVLHGLRTAGALVTSRHPLGDGSSGPAYRIVDAQDREWDLWFEAGGAWDFYDVDEPYPQAVSGVPGAGGPLGTDLMLIRPGECALLFECKHSWNPGVVARAGYLQALAYGSEAVHLADNITSVVVGPEGVVQKSGWTDTIAGMVGVIPPDDIPPLIEHSLGP